MTETKPPSKQDKVKDFLINGALMTAAYTGVEALRLGTFEPGFIFDAAVNAAVVYGYYQLMKSTYHAGKELIKSQSNDWFIRNTMRLAVGGTMLGEVILATYLLAGVPALASYKLRHPDTSKDINILYRTSQIKNLAGENIISCALPEAGNNDKTPLALPVPV